MGRFGVNNSSIGKDGEPMNGLAWSIYMIRHPSGIW